jgi:hypothetical protein
MAVRASLAVTLGQDAPCLLHHHAKSCARLRQCHARREEHAERCGGGLPARADDVRQRPMTTGSGHVWVRMIRARGRRCVLVIARDGVNKVSGTTEEDARAGPPRIGALS